jgi:hypothetical protein
VHPGLLGGEEEGGTTFPCFITGRRGFSGIKLGKFTFMKHLSSYFFPDCNNLVEAPRLF